MEFHLLESLLGTQNEEEGYSYDQIQAAEERLNLTFPKALKELYLKFGKNNIVNGQHYLVPPQHLKYYEPNHLVFYVENQAVGAWSLKWVNSPEEGYEIYSIDDFGTFTLLGTSLDEFLTKTSITYFHHYLFPYRYTTFDYYEKDEEFFAEYFGEPHSVDTYGENFMVYYWNSIQNILIRANFNKKPKLYVYTRDNELAALMVNNLGERKWEKHRDDTGSREFLERVKRYEDDF